MRKSGQPEYVQLAANLNTLNQTICANQSTFVSWQNAQNAAIPNSFTFFEEWLANLFGTSSQPNIDGPNDPIWGPHYTLFVRPILDVLIIWNELSNMMNSTPIEFYPSFVTWWQNPCASSSSVGSFIADLNSFLPFTIVVIQNQYSIGQCTGNPSGVAENLMTLVQSYSAMNFTCGIGLCEWGAQCYNQAFDSIGMTPPPSLCNCQGSGSCPGSSCSCTTTSPSPPIPPVIPSGYFVFVMSEQASGIVSFNSLTQLVTNWSDGLMTFTGFALGIGPSLAPASIPAPWIYLPGPATNVGGYLYTMCCIRPMISNGGFLQSMSVGGNPSPVYGIGFGKNNIYITVSNIVSILDMNFDPANEITIGSPQAIVVDPEQAYAYISNAENNSIVVLDLSTNAIADQINDVYSAFAGEMAITPNGEYLYVCSSTNNLISVIDISSRAVVQTLQGDDFNGPQGIAFTLNGEYAYVCNYNANSIAVIDVATNTVTTQITGGNLNQPCSISIGSDGVYAFVSNASGGFITMIDIGTNTISQEINIGGGLGAIGVVFLG